MNSEKVKKIVLQNKGWTAIGIFLVLMALGVVGLFVNSMGLTSQSADFAQEAKLARSGSTDIGIPPGGSGGSGSYVEVQEGSLQIKSKSIENDMSRIKNIAGDFNGWLESSSKNHHELYTEADLTVKVPSTKFEGFMSRVKQDFDVESYNVRNYRLYTEREEDELDVLNKTINDYENIRKEVKQMENSKEKLDLLMQITEKELDVKEKQRRFQNELSDKQQRGDYATVSINLREKREIDLMPDNLDQKFRNEVNEMVDNVANTLITTLTGGVEIFFAAIKYIIYLLIIAVPASVAYSMVRRIYRRFFQ